MSEVLVIKDKAMNVWGKLYIYLMFRVISEGMWIGGKDPKFWFNAILNNTMWISYTWHMDTGGYPDNFVITVGTDQYRLDEKAGERFSMSITYDDIIYPAITSFAHRATSMYEYMNHFAGPGKTMIAKIKNYQKLDINRWDEAFGPLSKAKALSYDDLQLSELTDMDMRIRGFELLADIDHIPRSHIRLTGETGKLVRKCRDWALFAIMEMERFHYATC